MKRLLVTAAIALYGVRAGAERVSDRARELLAMGPANVGYSAVMLRDSTRANRSIHLMIFFPTADDVAGKPLAVYDQLLSSPTIAGMCFPSAPETPSSTLCTLCLPPACTAKMTIDAADYASSVDAVDADGVGFPLVHQGVSVAPGKHPLVINLPGGGNNGLGYLHEAVHYASHGFIYVSVTHLGAARRQLVLDAHVVLDALTKWNETEGHALHGSFEPGWIFGTGHSLGGRSWLALTSALVPTDPLSPEVGLSFIPTDNDRIRGVAVKDATREAPAGQEPSWKAQLEANTSNVFLNSQACRPTQIALQQDLGGAPQRLDLEGVCPLRDGLNHGLFGQTCLIVNAHVIAQNPTTAFTLAGGAPTDFVAQCTEPNPPLRCTFFPVTPTVAQFRSREVFFARQTAAHNMAYFRTLMGDGRYRALLAPGQAREAGVSLINTSIGEGGDETAISPTQLVTGAEGFCEQAGDQDHGDGPLWSSDL